MQNGSRAVNREILSGRPPQGCIKLGMANTNKVAELVYGARYPSSSSSS